MKVGIIYGGQTGKTGKVANRICAQFPGSRLIPVSEVVKAQLEGFDLLILGTSTYGLGQLPNCWLDALPVFNSTDLRRKKVALFGLGDQAWHSDTFMDGMGTLHQFIREMGVSTIGRTSLKGYAFLASKALEGNAFIGLALDEDNQPELTDYRIRKWVLQLREEVKLPESPFSQTLSKWRRVA